MQKGAIFLNRLTEITKRDIYELFRDGCTVEDLFHTENVQYPYYGRYDKSTLHLPRQRLKYGEKDLIL